MMRLVFVSLMISAACAFPSFEDYLKRFPDKRYSPDELPVRAALYEASLAKIREHNNKKKSSYTMGINQFSDQTDDEIKRFKGYSGNLKEGGAATAAHFFAAISTGSGHDDEASAKFLDSLLPVEALPKSVDWRNKGAVTPAKNQGGCGSCWAFSATEVLESHAAIASGGDLLVMAPQQLVDCAPNPDDCGGTGGCSGSTQWLAFNYTEGVGGLSLEKDYPYKGETGTCNLGNIKPAATNKGYVRLPANNYTALMNAVATLGPIAISVDAAWSGYEGGVYDGDCGTTIDHAVVLVGYGTDPEGGDYYLVRNSWGEGWGEKGYIRIKRSDNDSNNCGINKDPSSGTECKPYPKKQKVCGLCGILSDSSYPTGVHTL